MSSELANVYADALLSVARDEGKVDSFKQEIVEITPLFSGDFIRFLATLNIEKKVKKDLVKMAFKDLNVYLLNFIYLLIDKNRIRYIKEIFKSYLNKANEFLKIKTVKVYSARPLGIEQKERLKKALKNKYQMEIELVELVDPSLIAGIKVVIDDKMLDASMANKISELKKTLKESW